MLAEDLENELGDKASAVTIKAIRDPGTTGNFEVFVDKELVHSKKTRGDKFLHQNQKTYEEVVNKVINAVGL